MSSKLKAYKGTSDSGNVNFTEENKVMILTNDAGVRTLMGLVTNGTNTTSVRIQANVSEEADLDEIVRNWLKIVSSEDEPTIDSELLYNVFECHNIVGLGQPIIFNGGADGVRLDRDYSGKLFVVCRYANAFLPGVKEQIVQDLKDSNEFINSNLKDLAEDLKLAKEIGDAEMQKESLALYQSARGNKTLNNQKIAALLTPHVQGMTKAFTSTDETEIREAFVNSGLPFDKIFPEGLQGGAETDAIPETDAINNPADSINVETTAQ